MELRHPSGGPSVPIPESPRVVLRLDLVIGSDPICGAISAPDGRSAPFRGWLQLTAALERVHEQGLASLPERASTA
jgi:hypothetical protein